MPLQAFHSDDRVEMALKCRWALLETPLQTKYEELIRKKKMKNLKKEKKKQSGLN